MGDFLRIDLTTRSSSEETLSPELVREYIGAKGIGTHILLEEVGPEVEPLSPENKMIFIVGPIGGTSMFGSNRYGAYFLSPLTNGYCECYSGGNLTPQFAKTGYKVIILEGRADSPVYIEISEEGATIHPADDLWGLDTYVAEQRLIELSGFPKAQACVIGPAGENLVRFACVENNKWHSLGRGGPGAVLGSKNVKGLVFHGEKKVEVARPDDFKALVRDMAERGKDDPGVAAYRRGGTVNNVRVLNGANAFPTHYWTKGTLEGFEALTTETMIEKYAKVNGTCPPCLIQCLNKNTIPDGPHAGLQLEGPEYETIALFGGVCEIADFGQIMYLNDICDRLGIDTMTAANLAGLAIEACNRGLIDLGLDYGDSEGVGEFLESIVYRRGLGDMFADGILRVEKELGLEGVAVHVKGMEPAGYDPRKLKGMGLGYITASRGACHLRGTFYKPELAGYIDPATLDGKAEMYVDWEDRLCVMDCLIYCRFYRDLAQWPYITAVVNAAIGTDFTIEELRRVASRITTESHVFNERRGFGPAQERLPAWLTERATDDEAHLSVTEAEMQKMRHEYYALRGWGTPQD